MRTAVLAARWIGLYTFFGCVLLALPAAGQEDERSEKTDETGGTEEAEGSAPEPGEPDALSDVPAQPAGSEEQDHQPDEPADSSEENDESEERQNDLRESRYNGPGSPRTERGINIPLARPTRAGALLLVIDHRAGQTFLEDAWTDYLGLDAGALKIGLGIRYGILDDLDVGIYRLNNTIEIFDVYEIDARWRFLNQAEHHLDTALRAGVTWFVQPDMDDAVGFYGQLLADRVFLDQLLLAGGFLFHSESSNDRKSLDDVAYSGALALVIEWRFIDLLALNAEVAVNVLGYGSEWPAFAFALEVITHRHTFALVFSNTQYVTADGIVAGSWRGFEELVFGFQITREINL